MSHGDHNAYTAELAPELASRFLLLAGVGMPARRSTCLLELQQHVHRTFNQGAPQQAERINKVLYTLVNEWYHWADATGRKLARFSRT